MAAMSLFEVDYPCIFALLQGLINFADISLGKNVNCNQLLGGTLDTAVQVVQLPEQCLDSRILIAFLCKDSIGAMTAA